MGTTSPLATRLRELAENTEQRTQTAITKEIEDPASPVAASLRATYAAFVSVAKHGAVADGVTNDWAAFYAAVRELESYGGGTLFLPKNHGLGHYLISAIDLPSNIIVESDGAKVTSTATNTFRALTGTQKGYGAVTNLRFKGIIFQGDFTAGATASVTLHHAQDVIFEDCVFTEVVRGNHAIDLGGCKDVTIRGCRFQGTNPGTTAAQYAEAIQLDSSNRAGMGNIEPDPSGYDGLPCENITVENCVFEPITVGGNFYHAPAPFGTHVGFTRVNKNITFRNNIVDRVFPQVSQIAVAAWLKFPGVQNLTIEGNTFKGDGENTRVIRVALATTGMPDSDVASATPSYSASITQEPITGLSISGNTFAGFLTTESGAELVSIEGRPGRYITDVRLTANMFRDCAPTVGPSTQGHIGILLKYVDGATATGNNVRGLRQFLGGNDNVNVTVSANILRDCRRILIDFGTTSAITITGNLVGGYGGGIQLLDGREATISGNILRYYVPTDKPSWMYGHLQMSGMTRVVVTGNTVRPAATGLATGVSWGTAAKPSTLGIIKDNMFYDGITSAVALAAGSTATVSGNEI